MSDRVLGRLVLLLAVVTALVSTWVKLELRTAEQRGPDDAKVGSVFPATTLPSLEGEAVDVSAFAAERKVTLISFWASWCVPCKLEMPRLRQLHQDMREKGFAVLSINVDREPEDLAAYLADHEVTFPVLLDPEGVVMKRHGLKALPSSIAIGSDGAIIGVLQGGESQMLRFQVEQWLQKAGASTPTGDTSP